MKKYLDIYKKVEEKLNKARGQNEMAYLREELMKEIDGNKDKYMAILYRCKEACDLSPTSVFFAMVTLLCSFLWGMFSDFHNTDSALGFVIILLFAYIFWVIKTKDLEKYRKMLIILENIDVNNLE